MIIVTGTKRSGTSMWMQVLVEAGLPAIGDRFPAGWGEVLRAANPDGFFESELVTGINFQTNPHPLTGAYLAPEATRRHAVKVFIDGIVRTDVAFIDRCIATVRSWRAYVTSMRRLQRIAAVPDDGHDGGLPFALRWWCSNYALVRDVAVRGYPAHVLSYDELLRDPERTVAEVLAWVGIDDPGAAARVVSPQLRTQSDRPAEPDAELAEGVEPRHLRRFDDLYAAIDEGRPLSDALIESLNETHEALRPVVLEQQARINAQTVAQLLPGA